MNADQVVSALREDAQKQESVLHICDSTRNALKAADLIESLQAKLAEYDEIAAEYGIDGKTMLTLAKSQIKTAQDNIKLQEQLTASQRREKAAVEDIHTVYSDGLCEVCGRRDACLMTLDRGEDGAVCHGIRFEWRGPQEAEKGDSQ